MGPVIFGFGNFSIFSIMFTLVFVLVIGIFVVTIVKGLSQWNKNNHSPELLVAATVVTKRTNISRHNHSHGDGPVHHTTSTSYYVTFEVVSGDRLEFKVSGEEYGMLVEGDHGELTFQGTRYLGFVRR